MRIKGNFQFKKGEKFRVFNQTLSGKKIDEGIVTLVRPGEGYPSVSNVERSEPWYVKFSDGEVCLRFVLMSNKQ